MKYALCLLVGVLLTLVIAKFGPSLNLVLWDQNMAPITLFLPIVLFWIVIIDRRDGLSADPWGDALMTVLLMIVVSALFLVPGMYIDQRLVQILAVDAIFTACWIVDYGLENNSIVRQIKDPILRC